jgi:predicted enzyme related to lactoylglutathione lyase
MTGQFVWFDLAAANTDEVTAFYGKLFGWSTTAGAGPYSDWFIAGEQPWAGVLPPGTREMAGRWVPYVLVDDLDTAAKRATSLGGTVVRDRTDGPAGTSVIVADPAGALVALFHPAPASR